MTDQLKSIRLQEFLKLLKEAEQVQKTGDLARFDEINTELNEIGYGIVWRDGKLYVSNTHLTEDGQ